MTYREFCNEIALSVVELQNECRKMTEDEFKDFQNRVLQEIRENAPTISVKFMKAIFNMIHKNIFAAEQRVNTEVA